MASLEQVGGQPGGAAIRDFLSVGHNDDGTLIGSALGSAGGSLAGSYPNPTIATGAVGPTQLASNALLRQAIVWDALGIIAVPPYPLGTDQGTVPGTLASQYLFGAVLGLVSGDVITNIICNVTTAASGTTPTLIKLGLCNSTGTVLGTTANLAADSRWTSTGWKTCALSSTVTISATGLYYALLLKNGTFGTTDLSCLYAVPSDVQTQLGSGYVSIGHSPVTDIGTSVTVSNDGSGRGYFLAVS